ncbi:endoglucanase [Devosia sp. MC532]|uniref:glycosyl hydrolase family 8 n=1 Tax=Devosia sp. MC532 TaxID=2799788 RepID=UPI0018F6D1E0|nr:glycosyl hydrolase family 8 [Devosia sp. MC532]MBJ7579121.1 endoglucanase [Devosia sp. MC532]
MKCLPLVVLAFLGLAVMPAVATSPQIHADEWRLYLDSYVEQNGRVIDRANGSISHSEGQGYGMILAVLADDRASFERIWSFTDTELLIRNDGLAAWRWEPTADPHVSDTNNATDGDILIAYGLLLAAEQWSDDAYRHRALAIIQTVGRTMIVPSEAGPAILPGQFGFIPEDGSSPILNPSYWVFEALDLFAKVDSSTDWAAISKAGLDILRRAAVSKAGVPGDWIQLKNGGVVHAPNHPAEFGYNNIRIPLYLIRAGANPGFLGPIRRSATGDTLNKISVINGAAVEPIGEPGYRLIVAAIDCVTARKPIPVELRSLQATSYYASTLQLLLLDHLRRNEPLCLGGGY